MKIKPVEGVRTRLNLTSENTVIFAIEPHGLIELTKPELEVLIERLTKVNQQLV